MFLCALGVLVVNPRFSPFDRPEFWLIDTPATSWSDAAGAEGGSWSASVASPCTENHHSVTNLLKIPEETVPFSTENGILNVQHGTKVSV